MAFVKITGSLMWSYQYRNGQLLMSIDFNGIINVWNIKDITHEFDVDRDGRLEYWWSGMKKVVHPNGFSYSY